MFFWSTNSVVLILTDIQTCLRLQAASLCVCFSLVGCRALCRSFSRCPAWCMKNMAITLEPDVSGLSCLETPCRHVASCPHAVSPNPVVGGVDADLSAQRVCSNGSWKKQYYYYYYKVFSINLMN